MWEYGSSKYGTNVNVEILLAKKFETGISKTPLMALELVLRWLIYFKP